jgi:hypothetical protein
MMRLSAPTTRAAAGARLRSAAAPAPRRSVIRRFKEDAPEALEAKPAAAGSTVKATFVVPHRVHFGQDLFVVGGHDCLGCWDVAAAVPMTWTEGDVWTTDAELPAG